MRRAIDDTSRRRRRHDRQNGADDRRGSGGPAFHPHIRLGRNLRHLVTLLDDLHALGVAFVSLGEGIDCTTPAGRLLACVVRTRLPRNSRTPSSVTLGCTSDKRCDVPISRA